MTPPAPPTGDSMNLPSHFSPKRFTPASLKGDSKSFAHLRLIDRIVKEPSRSIPPDAFGRSPLPDGEDPGQMSLRSCPTQPSPKPTRTNHAPKKLAPHRLVPSHLAAVVVSTGDKGYSTADPDQVNSRVPANIIFAQIILCDSFDPLLQLSTLSLLG